jgi:hypothetical protein
VERKKGRGGVKDFGVTVTVREHEEAVETATRV